MPGKFFFAHLALFVVNLVYGANYVIAKDVMPAYVSPSGFILMRVLGALGLFWLIFSFRFERIEKKDMGRLILCGLTGVAINQSLFFEGLALTSPVNAPLIMALNPLMVIVIAAFLLKEKITKLRLSGIIIGAIGAMGLVWFSSLYGRGNSNTLGDIFILINSLSYAFYLVLVKPLMTKYRPITVISWVFLFGSLFVVPLGISQFTAINWTEMPSFIAWEIVYVIVGVTFLTYLLNIFALKTVSPSVSSSYIYLQPVIAGLFAWIYSRITENNYSEDISWIQYFFGLLIFIGVFLVGRSSYLAVQKKMNTA
jgi:drug/metabolite transporter (DMT)-like permease